MHWSNFFLYLFLFGGLAVGSLTAMALLLPVARRYFGRRTLAMAAALPTVALVAMPGFGFLVFLIIATAASVLLVLPPLLKSPGDASLKRPIIPALAIFAADGWNTYILILAANPGFMGGHC